MKEILEVLITSGGTIEQVDDVRHIGNFSNGTTGALIAEEFLKQGWGVDYLHAKNAERPFRREMNLDPNKSFEEETKRLKKVYDEFKEYDGNLTEYSFLTFEDYHNQVKRLLTENKIDAVVLAAAVSDYGCEKQNGKIGSDSDELVIKMKRNPKVISEVKKLKPHVFQVGFKLLSGVFDEELIETAYKHGLKNKSDLTVANSINNRDIAKSRTYIIFPEKNVVKIERKDLAQRLAETVGYRISENHYKTNLSINDSCFNDYSVDIDEFSEAVKKFWNLNVFEPYYKGAEMHFGFFAKRMPQGFLITARGSNKENLTREDIVHVKNVDFEKRMLYVESRGKKASLNANIAGAIFDRYKDVNFILHSHLPLGKKETKINYAPGTKEDLDEIMKNLDENSVLRLKGHGCLIVGKSAEDIEKNLGEGLIYSGHPELYDVVYHRFQKSSDFLNLVKQKAGKDEKILDLACGTGEVAKWLINSGYDDVFLADKSHAMLEEAKKKLGNLKAYTTSIEEMRLDEKFDTIAMRQAVNYLLDYPRLVRGLMNIKDHLNINGKLIFNAPNYNGEKEYSTKELDYEYEGYKVNLREMNVVDGSTIIHTQFAILLDINGEMHRVYDINRFGLFRREDFENALKEVGYKTVDFTLKNKSLYCVAGV
jgi:phosphopantothenate-cysteine ligase